MIVEIDTTDDAICVKVGPYAVRARRGAPEGDRPRIANALGCIGRVATGHESPVVSSPGATMKERIRAVIAIHEWRVKNGTERDALWTPGELWAQAMDPEAPEVVREHWRTDAAMMDPMGVMRAAIADDLLGAIAVEDVRFRRDGPPTRLRIRPGLWAILRGMNNGIHTEGGETFYRVPVPVVLDPSVPSPGFVYERDAA